ncbi:MAG: 50S ribosomal protein L24 [Candidatus Doudnabacteria bacterium RIFCSPHIGHO2_02_FULL_48_21]|uniref:Large ribosomal subunit protein uL24 n=1 Tax=Candidatus Doudnabacteria bacterium RIFCSPLOWO2_02_FULL_48_13 TaxID=1817845 RepID=A0A1F5QC76_9BACT|nr:ribosomal protein L24 [uncultured bacterium]OGE76247.1 MAG: 50S ribosomal protein L24 [Candidatus Doudnabacteria bacterium RIFCSPHIGHO2_01_48_18]OGE77518.1 MAG: 50S ribosomal protein L24 [Candidatus Doudnabacteria bacterium RIFCSPHIGHO2_01_FULL_48_180]OGE91659.1 MAG: 50S ribosomal protein L24 [Candidatus Doudnabacteria bacterium RIFCSPHIGHO2_12_FULL_47_25]OGE93353.1 MAG: 50S ribosomal protein L24 [Candidatus Doudnabacteria bacterium RIFCSPHIGHO2_02_FULL_48_21]OGE97437.1 MAG: 50S ribosomal p
MFHIRKGDTVKILSGKDRSKTGKVLSVDAASGKAIIDGRNIMVRHERPKKAGQKGQKIQYPSPIFASNLALVCPSCGKAARVGFKQDDKGQKIRICKKCGKEIK